MRNRWGAVALALALGGPGCEVSEGDARTTSGPTTAATPAAPGQQVLTLHVDGL